MEIQPATPEQIATFKKAAAARYLEKGIDPKTADRLFNEQMAKFASDLGVQTDTSKADKIDKIASAIAEQVGRKRVTYTV